MQEDEQKGPVNRFEIAYEIGFLTAAGIALYFIGIKWVLGREWYYPWRIIPVKLSTLIVLGLGVAWIIAAKKWLPTKNAHIKIILKILTMLVLTLLAMILTDLYVIYLFRHVW
jgi:hypothetical protein